MPSCAYSAATTLVSWTAGVESEGCPALARVQRGPWERGEVTSSIVSKQLYLLRHAKSSWDDPALTDHDRPLAPRGRAATALLAAHLRRRGIAPALVLCSPAQRVAETLEGIAAALGEDVTIQTEQELYGASAADLLERLRRLGDAVPSAMLIGHNPAVQQLAVALGRGDECLTAVERKYPTGALATFALDGEWPELAADTVELVEFVRPKDLR